jgi:hypothetical protein
MTSEFFDSAIAFFNSLPREEVSDEFKNGDLLFQQFGIGNTVENVDRPFEKITHYETLLSAFQRIDPVKYKNLHKGTPYYFLAWLYFDMHDYAKGMFYIDAAISEDSVHRFDWKNGVASQFYTLESKNDFSKRTTDKIEELLTVQLGRYSSLNYVSKTIDKNDFVKNFVRVILNDGDVTKRSLISALYVFILEYNVLEKLLNIRTAHSGSTLPFLTHLFSGGAIFESLLKEIYPSTKKGSLSTVLGSRLVKGDFGLQSIQIDYSANSLNDILSTNRNNLIGHLRSFTVVSQLRNTTGHNLVWDDIFDSPTHYTALFEYEIDAIFYVITTKYLS